MSKTPKNAESINAKPITTKVNLTVSCLVGQLTRLNSNFDSKM